MKPYVFDEVAEHGDPEALRSHHDKKEDDDKTKKSAFNMAIASLERINTLLNEITRNYMLGDPDGMRNAIKCLFMEICPKLSIKEREKFKNEYKKLAVISMNKNKIGKIMEDEQKLYGMLNSMDLMQKGFKTTEDIKIRLKKNVNMLRVKYFDQLENLRIQLGDYLEKKGLLIPGRADTRFIGGAS